MCGICGKFVYDRENSVSESVLRGMTDTLYHRGPDDSGYFVSGQIGLGFRRLSIIDLSGGHQPLSNEDGTIWVAFNGEIYNYRSLREDLIAKGHTFKTNSDTEVIVHAYEQYGIDCVNKFRGMFAFAVWDGPQQALFLARDRVGIKPLYYYVDKKFLSFGSEIKAILHDPAVRRDLAPGMIDRFLTYYYLPGDETLLRNLYKLPPGHTLFVKNGRHEVRRYWDLEFSSPEKHKSSADLEQELIELLDEVVDLHMISDVPVGFLLSGGLDSTALLSFAAAKSKQPIKTFTIGFSSQGVVDERPYARLAAKHYGCEHHELSISPDEFASFLPEYVWHMEEPVCQPPAIALYYVSKLASQHVKVLISGEGGDEAFAGYENYRNLFWFENFKRVLGPLRSPLGRAMSFSGEMLDSRRLSKYGARMDVRFDKYYLSRTSSPFEFFPRERKSLYSDALAAESDNDRTVAVTKEYLARASKYDILNQMLYVDTNTWLPDELLVKADKMTMANSVELRVPLLDHKLLEFAARLPRNQKVRRLTMKYLAKNALRGRVPKEILNRRKAGFPVPYESWLRGHLRDWVSDVLLDSKALSRDYFKRGALEELLRKNASGTGYGKELFSLVTLELWHRRFVDRQDMAA